MCKYIWYYHDYATKSITLHWVRTNQMWHRMNYYHNATVVLAQQIFTE